MPTSTGPNISGEENLVFGFDLLNPINSYLGEPTYNQTSNSRDFSGTSYGYGGEWPYDPTSLIKTYYPNLKTPIGNGATLIEESGVTGYHHLSSWGGGSESGEHSLSCYVHPLTQGIIQFTIGLLGDGGNVIIFDLDTLTITYGGGISNRNAFIRPVVGWPGWYRIGANYEGRFGGWVGCLGYSIWQSYSGINGGKKCYITGIQYEFKSHPTPFVEAQTSRSDTQGLIDLKGSTTINLSTVSFDGNAQMIFDGTDDWLNVSIALNSGNFTYETIMSSNSTTYEIFSAGFGTPIIGGGTTIQSFITAGGAVINLYAPIGAGGWVYGSTSNVSQYVSISNRLRHIVVTNNGVSWKTYVDGTLVGDVNFYQPDTGDAIGIARLAMQGFSNTPSDVKMVNLYNRVLTSSEVLNNYNNIKRKYGI